MKEYIEKDKAVGIAHGYCHTKDGRCCGPDDVVELYEELKTIPAADVVEVRHGKWVWDENGMDWGLGAWECSECHRKPETWWETDKGNPYRCAGSSYCSNCGAKMTEEHHEQKE